MDFTIEQIEWMGKEVNRQLAGPKFVVGMARGVEYIDTLTKQDIGFVHLDHLCKLVTLGLFGNGFRQTPIVFGNMYGKGNSPDTIPDAMAKLVNFIWDLGDSEIDEWVKIFLKIHPYEDGNGRMAVILRNWLMGTLKTPTPLPDYGW